MLPDLKLVPEVTHCPACLGTGTVWDFAHVLKIRCKCNYQPATLKAAA
jgi:hypothetical protein